MLPLNHNKTKKNEIKDLLLFHYSYFQLTISFSIKMSYTKSNIKAMHCKVCEDAGKPKSMIISHYPKNRDGFTVCPTLLSQECRNCLKKGHTIKYCTKTSQKMNPLKEELNQYKNKKAAKQLMLDVSRAFDALYESSDDEEEEEVAAKPVAKEPVAVKPSWASVVKKDCPKIDWATAESDSEGDEEEE